MKTIELTQNQAAIIDDWNYEWLSQWKWQARWNKHTRSFYAIRSDGKHPFRKTIYMVREILKTPSGIYCDHINHNTLDNREKNLRNVTNSENAANRCRANRNNKLGEKNICRNGNGFLVQVEYGEMHFRRTYKTLDLAIKARDKTLKKYNKQLLQSEK